MTEKMPSSTRFGSLPMSSTMSRYSSSVRLCWSRRLLSIMAGLLRGGRAAAGRPAPLQAENDGLEDPPAVGAAEDPLGGPFGMGHEPEDVAPLVADAGDGLEGAVDVGRRGHLAVGVAIAEDDLAPLFDLPEDARRSVVAPVEVGDGDAQDLALPEGPGKIGPGALDPDMDVLAEELEALVPQEGPGQQADLAED